MKNVSKLFFGVCLAIGLAIAVSGCSSGPAVYDRSVPLEQSSTLKIIFCSVIEFDGKSTALSPIWSAHNGGTKEVIIPAGTHSLILYAETRSGTRLLQVANKNPISYDFLPGHTYMVRATAEVGSTGAGGAMLKTAIVDVADLNRELVPDPTRADASPFEGTWVSNNGDRLIISGNEYIVYQANKIVPWWRGTFSYNSQSMTLDVLYGNQNKQSGGWMPYASLLQRIYDYNGTTLRGQVFATRDTIEFSRAQ